MGYASLISDDIIDKGHENGINTGWSSISPRIRYSSKELKILSNLGISGVEEVQNIADIVFIKKNKDIEELGRIELIHKWKFVTESRINFLLSLKRNITFDGTKRSVNASLSDLYDAYDNILEILKDTPDLSYTNIERNSDSDYAQLFCKELVLRLIAYLKYIDNEDTFKIVIMDLKHLIAVVLNSKNEDDEFICTIMDYVQYLKRLNISHIERECRECSIDVVFNEYNYCLVCGKRRQ